jgi:hypothetical protein
MGLAGKAALVTSANPVAQLILYVVGDWVVAVYAKEDAWAPELKHLGVTIPVVVIVGKGLTVTCLQLLAQVAVPQFGAPPVFTITAYVVDVASPAGGL